MIKTYDQAMKIFSSERSTHTTKYTNDMMSQANDFLGKPDTSYKKIHVAGTNGKGSVCNMVFSILQYAGKKVGCFTGPYLLNIRENIKTENGNISKKDFVKIVNLILATGVPVSRFEMLTLVALLYFKEQCCEYVVLETGLGGLYDATNIVHPAITCITNIGYDHGKILGPTLDDIAKHKAGIIKEGVPLVLDFHHTLVEEYAGRMQAPMLFSDRQHTTNLIGDHQKSNAGLAYTICIYLGFSPSVIEQGLLQVKHMGRMHYLSNNLLIDGAHNLDGFLALKKYLATIKEKYTEIIYCFSLKKGKNPKDLVLSIFGHNQKYILVDYENEKLEIIENLAKNMTGYTYHIKTPWQIKNLAKKNENTLYVVFGSLYMIGQLLK